jgi:hypothetical protein
MRTAKSTPGFASRHPAVVGLPLGIVAGITVLALAALFAGTRNWAGLGATGAGFLAFIVICEIWRRVERKRATGTYSYSFARAERARSRRQG